MDLLTELLFESPWPLCLLLGAVTAFGLLLRAMTRGGWAWLGLVVSPLGLVWSAADVIRSRREAGLGPRLAVGATAASLALVMLAWVVRTDRERIEANLTAVADHVAAGDMAAAFAHVDDPVLITEAELPAMKDQYLDAARALRDRIEIRWIRCLPPKTTVDGDEATMEVRAIVRMVADGQEGNLPTDWRLGWVKRDDRWLLRSVVLTGPPIVKGALPKP